MTTEQVKSKSKQKKVKTVVMELPPKIEIVNTPAVIPKEQPKKISELDGMRQCIIDPNGVAVELCEIVTEKEVWLTKGRVSRTILTHSGVQKIADRAGVSKVVQYQILTQPDASNNYQYTIQATICMLKSPNICATEIGESNRNNLGSKGRGNPANMAQKRAYDRAIFRLLGITGLLSEEELSDNETEDPQMDNLSPEDSKAIAPIINQLLLAKTKEQLAKFNNDMKIKSKELNPEQLDYLRKLYKKSVAEQSKTKF